MSSIRTAMLGAAMMFVASTTGAIAPTVWRNIQRAAPEMLPALVEPLAQTHARQPLTPPSEEPAE